MNAEDLTPDFDCWPSPEDWQALTRSLDEVQLPDLDTDEKLQELLAGLDEDLTVTTWTDEELEGLLAWPDEETLRQLDARLLEILEDEPPTFLDEGTPDDD